MKVCRVYILLLKLVVLTEGISANEPVVKLSHGGEVRGSFMKSQKGRRIYAFRGIPYAEAPIGEKRFKPPVPKTSWQDTPHDATKDGPVCVQVDAFSKALIGREDCLYLNVYSPKLPRSDNETVVDDDNDGGEKRAVMVLIHGGAFEFGYATSAMYGPGRLLDGNVVLVSMNYRLGPLGFLSTSDDAARGNYGLMDQSLALKWINKNIEAFGGDANRVTIFGESAGGASVGYHLLSPMSSGLFHAGISQSGSSLCSWAFQEEPVYWAKKLAEEFNCSTNASAEIVTCLRGVSAKDIIKKSVAFKTAVAFPVIFTPTLDGSFLSIDPREAMRSGKVLNKVPLITGINKDEGIVIDVEFLRANRSSELTSRKGISEVIKYILDDKGSSDEPSNLIIKKYLPTADAHIKEASRKAVTRMFSDSMIAMGHYETAKLLSEHGFQIYTYRLEYVPSLTIANFFGLKENGGVGHGDELFLLFDGMILGLLKPNKDDKKVIKTMLSLWTNFAKYGDPTPNITKLVTMDWEPSLPGKLNVFHINKQITTSTYDTAKEELFQFWTEKLQKVLDKTIQRRSKDKNCKTF